MKNPDTTDFDKANIDKSHFGPMARYRHHEGGLYTVICVAASKKFPADVEVVYRSRETGLVWRTTPADWFGYVSEGVRRYAPCGEDGKPFTR